MKEFVKKLKKNSRLTELRNFLIVDNPSCPVCGKILFRDTILCRTCADKLQYIGEDECVLCKKTILVPCTWLCQECCEKLPYLSNGFSLYKYDDISKKIILDFKYNLNRALARMCGSELGKKLADNNLLSNDDLLIPIPLTENKIKVRGYNQSEYIAMGISEITGNRLEKDILIKIFETKDQMILDAKERSENIKNAFDVINPEKLKGKTVVLVDDVITTGSTLNECAKVLLSVGVQCVKFVTVASA